jgi:uncharacterized protein (DUF2249 family)
MQTQNAHLDCREIAPDDRLPNFLRDFDRLPPGASLELVSAEDPSSYLQLLQDARQGQFEWRPLQSEPEEHCVEVERRADIPARGVGAFLGSEQRWILRLIADIAWRVSQRQLEDALRRLRRVEFALDRLMMNEEQVAFPKCEHLTQEYSALTRRLRAEHDVARRMVGRIKAALQAGDDTVAAAGLGDLLEVLGSHAFAEQEQLHPLVDLALGDGADKVIAEMRQR